MPDSQPTPNRGPPAKIQLTASVEVVNTSLSSSSRSNQENSTTGGLWKSLKSKANVFNIFERAKSSQPLQPPQPGVPTSTASGLPAIPLESEGRYEVGDEEEDKLKNDYDRTFRRSTSNDKRRRASTRITISTLTGDLDLAYHPHLSAPPFMAPVTLNAIADLNASTTALSTISLKTNADDALVDFPDLGKDLEKYIREGTPSPLLLEEAEKKVSGFIPFDERVESYDEDFELGGVSVSPEVNGMKKGKRGRSKSVRFASNDTDIEAKNEAARAVEVHRRMMEGDERAGGDGEEKRVAPKSFLPRPAFPKKNSSEESNETVGKIRTPSPAKSLRPKPSMTISPRRSPPPKRPLAQKESMTFRAQRNDSPSRTPRGLTSPSKTSLVHRPLTSPSKTNLGYVSPTKNDRSRFDVAKQTEENTRANTPTSPIKLTPIHSHTSSSPVKTTPARSRTPPSARKPTPLRPHTPPSPAKPPSIRSLSHTPTSPTKSGSKSKFTTSTSTSTSIHQAKSAHLAAQQSKASQTALLRQQTQMLLDEKRVRDEEALRVKREEIRGRRKGSVAEVGGDRRVGSRLPVPVKGKEVGEKTTERDMAGK